MRPDLFLQKIALAKSVLYTTIQRETNNYYMRSNIQWPSLDKTT